MTLVVTQCAQRHRGTKVRKLILNCKGQMSIFFATTVLALITFIAFIVNIGVFVKSKINLQNAVDAAAWSGAAVQARQLTNIAYMNWEMRNTYKEWMFKYYVLGNLSLDVIASGPGASSDFRMPTVDTTLGQDSYNFPSVCINFADTGGPDICQSYAVPGIPVFGAENLPGVDETTTAFVNTITAEKNKDCGDRTTINFLTTNLWAYNVRDDSGTNIADDAPEVAAHRQGAFPQAFEMALRIRNLEKLVNKPPFSTGVCADASNAAGNCGNGILDIISSGANAIANERIVKSFYAGYRNLGSDADKDMKNSFTLTELPPSQVYYDQEFSLSNLLIPGGTSNRTKYYLDLKLMTMNYATFFTSFSPSAGAQVSTSVGNVDTDGQCDATKIALPVPGYPLGYVKNPRVLTYYAVKGQARFTGLFNPFDVLESGIKLTAYAAAKPFGGRIGPMLMSVFGDQTKLYARFSGGKHRSSPYLIGVDVTQVLDRNGNSVDSSSTYVPGAPLPLNGNPSDPFWLTNVSEAVGGWTATSGLVFSLPNIPWDYPAASPNDSSSYYANEKIDLIQPAISGSAPKSGLYNGQILTKLIANLNNIGGTISPDDIDTAVMKARQPTLYDAYNYMVPTPEQINATVGVDSFGQIQSAPDGDGFYEMTLFAPLISDIPDTLYSNLADVVSAYDNYILAQEKAIKKYIVAMNHAAINMSSLVSSDDGTPVGLEAARKYSDIDFSGSAETEKPSCSSLAGRFAYFYMGNATHVNTSNPCPRPMKELIQNYWSANLTELGNFYTTKIFFDPTIQSKLFSSYRPGPLNDASPNGIWKRAISSSITEKMWRNFYSTKLVQVKSLQTGGNYDAASSNFAIHSEGNNRDGALDELKISSGSGQAKFQNSLDATAAGVDLSTIDH
jgi:hypothetical protein